VSEEDDLLEVVRDVCARTVAPRAAEIDRDGAFPADVYGVFNQLGLPGLLVPEEHGGAGASLLVTARVYEELAAASATCALILSNSVEALLPIVAYADDALREEALERVLERGEIPCFALTEPEAGSDATNLATTARSEGDSWLLSGRKQFITNGSVGQLFTVFAMTDPEARRSRRLSAFVVDRDAPGFEATRDEDTMGTRGAPLSELVLDDVPGRLLGEPGQGLEIAMHMINESRVGAAAQCVGIGRAALERSLGYAQMRHQFGRPIAEFQAVQLLLADMAIRTEAARQLTAAAARAHDERSGGANLLSAMCKTLASDSAVASALDAIQVHGATGYTAEAGVERLLRDAKAYQIFDGTNEIQRLTIAKGLQDAASIVVGA